MFLRLLLLFTVVPLIELFLLIWVGQAIGALATIVLVIVTGTLGAWLARSQGLRTLERVRQEWAGGQIPAAALVDGLLILVAGAVLLTPGILTDLAGFFLLVPQGRRQVAHRVADYFRRRTERLDSNVIIIDSRPTH